MMTRGYMLIFENKACRNIIMVMICDIFQLLCDVLTYICFVCVCVRACVRVWLCACCSVLFQCSGEHSGQLQLHPQQEHERCALRLQACSK